jgi:cysteine-rich repeat protein
MKTRSVWLVPAVVGILGTAGLVTACANSTESVSTQLGEELATQGKTPAKAPMLNLSHIECTEDGHVLAHFVLLFNGEATPGTLSGTYNGGSFGPVAPSKTSGNVWHYNVILPAGEINIYSAQVTAANGSLVTLHNPGEYAGDYFCGEVPVCELNVQPQDLYCTAQPLGNPEAECGAFGLLPQGKDDNLSGLTFVSTQDAYVAIVKSGSGGCGPGNSAYRIYTNVHEGDVLSTPVDQNISHITYCACAAVPPPPPPPPSAYCGDGIVNGNEQCDDGNSDETDMCLSNCTWNTPDKK